MHIFSFDKSYISSHLIKWSTKQGSLSSIPDSKAGFFSTGGLFYFTDGPSVLVFQRVLSWF